MPTIYSFYVIQLVPCTTAVVTLSVPKGEKHEVHFGW